MVYESPSQLSLDGLAPSCVFADIAAPSFLGSKIFKVLSLVIAPSREPFYDHSKPVVTLLISS